MKKQIILTFLLTVLMSMVGTRAFAHDIEWLIMMESIKGTCPPDCELLSQ